MRLDLDCVRDILFCEEENTNLRKRCFFVDSGLVEAAHFCGNDVDIPPYQSSLLNKYENDILIYHVHYCLSADLIVGMEDSDEYQIWIADLSPKGHEFLSNIRANSNWEETKKIGSKVGAFGLNMAAKIAEGVATASIKQMLSLP